jgi:hypothetical protein
MASYGWTVQQVDDLPFVTAMELMKQVRRYPPPSVLHVDMMEQANRETEAEAERKREDSLRKMGAVTRPRRRLVSMVVKKTGQRIV